MEDKNEIIEDNKFCSKEANKDNNIKEAKNQINKITDKFKEFSFIKTNSYSLLHGKLTISLSKNEKKELVDKYWTVKPRRKFDFYGKEIKNLHENENISGLKDLVGVLMIYKKLITSNEFKKFDKYFSIIIKSHERNYMKPEEHEFRHANESEEKKYGKILYVGGNLKNNLGAMFKDEFDDPDDKILPIYVSIMIYSEYEEIELDAFDFCNKSADHHGFSDFSKVFHNEFAKKLSNKIERIKTAKITKREDLLKKEKEI